MVHFRNGNALQRLCILFQSLFLQHDRLKYVLQNGGHFAAAVRIGGGDHAHTVRILADPRRFGVGQICLQSFHLFPSERFFSHPMRPPAKR